MSVQFFNKIFKYTIILEMCRKNREIFEERGIRND